MIIFLSKKESSLGVARIKWTTVKAPEYVCARHGSSRIDVGLSGFFLCKNCVSLLKKNVFADTEPAYQSSSSVDGFCAYCGNKLTARQTLWFLCSGCDRIVRSYAIERAASAFVLNWWNTNRKSNACTKKIKLEQTDPVKLMSFNGHKEWKKNASTSNPDFTGIDEETGKKLFAIEMKTGRNAINKMSAFQLDVTDCDDILSFVKKLKIPAYLFHVWVTEEYEPPTFRKVALDTWWMSVYDMEANFQQIRTRQREQRPAAYFKKSGFKLKEEFLRSVCENELKEFAKRLSERVPTLYVLSPENKTKER